MKILELLDYEDYPPIFVPIYDFKTDLINKLNSYGITTMKELAEKDFEYYYEILTKEELEELIYHLCNY